MTSRSGKGGLYAGGFNRQVKTDGMYVIDLTGTHYKKKKDEIAVYDDPSLKAFATVLEVKDEVIEPKGWLSFPIEDFQVPDYSLKIWVALAEDIIRLMNAGENVVLTCAGGHGRTGLAAAIICWLLDNEGVGDNPVEWIRKIHCREAVETVAQVDYVFKTLEPVGLPQDKRLKTMGSKAYNTGTTVGATYKGQTYEYAGKSYTWDKETQKLKPIEPGKDAKEKIPGESEFKKSLGPFEIDDYEDWYDRHYMGG